LLIIILIKHTQRFNASYNAGIKIKVFLSHINIKFIRNNNNLL